jgi:uncharacterized protein
MEHSSLVTGVKLMSAVTVAKIGYDGLMKGQSVVVPGLKNKLYAFAVRFLPRDFVTRYAYNAQKPVNK